MTAYELAEKAEGLSYEIPADWSSGEPKNLATDIADMLRQQADRIAELENQKKPLSDKEIKEAFNQWLMLDEGVARFDYQLKHTWVVEQWERWQEAFKSAEVLK